MALAPCSSGANAIFLVLHFIMLLPNPKKSIS